MEEGRNSSEDEDENKMVSGNKESFL